MKVIPSWLALWRTVMVTLFAGSMFANVIAFWCWSIFEAKWQEVLETAEFNDLDGDGTAWVYIEYETDDK